MAAAATPAAIGHAPPAAVPVTTSTSNSLHRYVTYDPQATLTRSGRWKIFWNVARAVNLLVCLSLAAIGLSLVSGSALAGAFAVVSLFGGMVAWTRIEDHLSSKAREHAKLAQFATDVLSKMSAIKDAEIPAKLTALGIDPASISLSNKTQLKTLIARYEVGAGKFEEQEQKIKKLEQDIPPLPYKNLAHAKAVQKTRLEIIVRHAILAELKLGMAHVLHVLSHPHDTRAPSAFFTPSPVELQDQMFMRMLNDPLGYVHAFKTGGGSIREAAILAATPQQLRKIVFSDASTE